MFPIDTEIDGEWFYFLLYGHIIKTEKNKRPYPPPQNPHFGGGLSA